jgi:hypothetical protein
MTVTLKKPNPEQLAAVAAYADKHGEFWKEDLQLDWMTGTDASRPSGHLLRQIRNQFGPKWLTKVTKEDLKC